MFVAEKVGNLLTRLQDQTRRCGKNLTSCGEESWRLFGLLLKVCDCCRLCDLLEAFEFFPAPRALPFSISLAGS